MKIFIGLIATIDTEMALKTLVSIVEYCSASEAKPIITHNCYCIHFYTYLLTEKINYMFLFYAFNTHIMTLNGMRL